MSLVTGLVISNVTSPCSPLLQEHRVSDWNDYKSLLLLQTYKSNLRNRQSKSRSAYVFCWWIAFGEMNDLWFWDIITTSSRGFSELSLDMPISPIIGHKIPCCEIAVCPVMAASAFRQSPQAESADSMCFYERTFSLLIAKRSPDAFFFLCESAPVWLMWSGSAESAARLRGVTQHCWINEQN